MRSILIFGISLLAPIANAEYRVHRLLIRNVETGAERTIASTLDHMQYTGYYPLKRNETIEYVTSWRCWGRTDGFKPLCPQPEAVATQPKPNSTSP